MLHKLGLKHTIEDLESEKLRLLIINFVPQEKTLFSQEKTLFFEKPKKKSFN